MALTILLLATAGAFPQAERTRGVGVQVRAENGTPVELYKESHALMIGVSDYSGGWRKLPGVNSDIVAVEAVLRAQGFKVETAMNLGGRALDQTIRDFIGRHGQAFGNRLLIYFAGHGETLKTLDGRELGYIVPADAPLASRNIARFKQTAISMDMVEAYARLIESKHALFVFDSCFSGSLFETGRAAPPPSAITNRTALPVRQFITAGTADQEVPDDSVFREQFVEALNGMADMNGDGYITGSELGEFLEDSVANYSQGIQTPRWGKIRNPKLDKGNFVFVSPTKTGVPPAPGGTAHARQPDAPVQTVYAGQFCAAVSTLVASGRKGFHDIIGEPTFKTSTNSFASSLNVPGAKSSRVAPDLYASYVMAESENVGDVAGEYYRLVNKLAECLPAWQQTQDDSEPDVVTQISKYKRIKFTERKDGVTIVVSHNRPAPAQRQLRRKYYLRLTVNAQGTDLW